MKKKGDKWYCEKERKENKYVLNIFLEAYAMDNPFNNQFKVPGFCEYFLYLDLSQLGVFVRKDEREKYRECKWVKNRADVGVFSLREVFGRGKKIHILKSWILQLCFLQKSNMIFLL